MREIKFRIWDKTNERWIDPQRCMFHLSGRLEAFLTEDVRNSVVMQYTGLKDKNGVEIYEGDIVKCHGLYPDDRSNGKIFEVKYSTYDGAFFYPFSGCEIRSMMSSQAEVIGNIYENPELLEKKE